MKKIFYILLPVLLFSCSENNKEELYINYNHQFEYLADQIDNKIDEGNKNAEDHINDLLRGNPVKLGPLMKLIKKIHTSSDSVCNMLEKKKIKILNDHNQTKIEDLRNLKTKTSDIDIMHISEELKKYGTELKTIIKDYKLSEQIAKHIKNTLAADRTANLPIFNSKKANSAELYSIFSMLQYRIKLIESDILHNIYYYFDNSCSFSFVNINAVVIPKAKEIYLGDTFEAEIFLAAWDSTSSPVILIGGKRLKINEGKAQYKKLISSKDTGLVTELGYILRVLPGSSNIDSVPFTIEYKIIK